MIETRDILFAPAGQIRRLHIFLPENYGQTEETYPVMYFFDGHNLFRDQDATYGKSWGLGDFLRRWEKPMLIVGLECGHGEGERLQEYCPYPVQSRFLGRLSGMGDATLRWMVETLKPQIDADYRTCPFREATGIGGSSMGGLMSLYGILRFNRWFSKAACLSSLLLPQLKREAEQAALFPDTRVYLSWGTEEAGGARARPEEDWTTRTAQRNLALARRLEARGIRVRLHCQRQGRHCEADWERQVPGFMDYLWREG